MSYKVNTPNAPAEVRKGFISRVASIIQRSALARRAGLAFDGNRDLYQAFGWHSQITEDMIWGMYYRGGVANRIVHSYPAAAWGRPPQLYVEDNQVWNTAWDTLVGQTSLWDAIHRADVLAGLGRYSIILLGTTSTNMQTPMRMGAEITYLQPYAERHVRISKWVTDPTDKRFGQPLEYAITPPSSLYKEGGETLPQQVITPQPIRVHYTNVIHVVRDPLESTVFGTPYYMPIWNYLTDLQKVIGASSESYWLTANRGLHANVAEDMDLSDEDEANLAAEVDEYIHGLRRVIRTRGVNVTPLGTDVANPKGPFDVLITLISSTTGIPKRILVGSEAGQLASEQDRANWAERIEEYRRLHCFPNILTPLISRIIEQRLLPEGPKLADVQVLWPEAFRMSPLERAQTGAQTARTLANITKGLQPIEIKPATPGAVEFDEEGNPIPGTERGGTAAEYAEPLITRDEARRIIGLSTDNAILTETPDH